jgi:hypothetical protein
MLVEESRIFEVSTLGTLHFHWRELDRLILCNRPDCEGIADYLEVNEHGSEILRLHCPYQQ